MQETTLHIKTDRVTRDDAKTVAKQLGMSLTTLVNVLLKQISKTGRIELTVDEEPSTWLLEQLHLSDEDEQAGRVSPAFHNAHDAIAWLNDPAATDKHGTRIHD